MSSDIVWLLTRSQNAFLVKRNGIQLLSNSGLRNSLKNSGLTEKAVSVSPTENGVNLTIKSSKGKKHILLKGNVRQSAKAVKVRFQGSNYQAIVAKYRPDMVQATLARVSALIAARGPAKVVKAKKVRSSRK